MKKIVLIMFMVLISLSLIAGELTLYSSRQPQLMDHIIERYEKEKGVKVIVRSGEAPDLLQRILVEGEASPADIFITVDVGNLWFAAEKGVLVETKSAVLEKNIPAYLRDEKGLWFGLSIRARTIVYNPKKVKEGELSTYEDLATEKWKNRLVLRTSKKVYNQSLVAMLIEKNGEAETEKILSGWVNNLATDVMGNDTKVMEAIEAGIGDVGIVNTYYFGRLQKEKEGFPLKLFWPNQKDSGVHVNISGAGILKNSKNKAEALKFLEWLSEGDAQQVLASLNMEYPVNKDVAVDPLVKSWGEFKQMDLPLSKAGVNQAKAVKLMKKVNYK